MRICITRSERFSYSETFIRDQIAQFSKTDEVFSIHTCRLPQFDEQGRLLSNRLFWLLHQVIKGVTGKRNNLFGEFGIHRYLVEKKIDVVLANYGLTAAHMVPICAKASVPLVVIFHGHDATDRKLVREYRKLYLDLFTYASAIVAVSKDIGNRLVEMGADESKVYVVPCGVNTDDFHPQPRLERSKKFIAIGRFTAKKGPEFTIQAFHRVWLKHPDSKLIMVGAHKGLYTKCEALVHSLGLSEAVTFTGILSHDKLSDLLIGCLAFVQHSMTAPNGDTEGTPVSILEASACGLPIISTYHGGIKEAVIQNVTGFLVEEGDIEGMANYMTMLIEDQHGAAMGKAGREHIVRNYNQKNQIERIRRLALGSIS